MGVEISSELVTVDPVTGYAYMTLGKGEIEETLELGGGVVVDLDSKGTVLGIEGPSLSAINMLGVQKIVGMASKSLGKAATVPTASAAAAAA
jgi:uncharacterized protein YuzE